MLCFNSRLQKKQDLSITPIKMMKSIAKRFSTVELSATIPPKLKLKLPTTTSEFTINPAETIEQLVLDIKNEDSQVSSVEFKKGNSLLSPNTHLKEVMKDQFQILINNSPVEVFPGVHQFIRENENLYTVAFESGVPFNEARKAIRFATLLKKDLKDEFSQEELHKAIHKSLEGVSKETQEEVKVLESQAAVYERELSSFQEKLQEIQTAAEKYADFWINSGLFVFLGQWSGIAYFTFVKYGWDVMEPVSYLIGSGWAILGYLFFMRNREEFIMDNFREMMIQKKKKELMEKEGLDLQRMHLVERNLHLLNSQIQSMKEFTK